ncbi:MAG TPA: ABC transporter permease subunit [Anaerolineales bacterium]|nr:ABC transporter permease subunit [Anaerolineales bacterium]
MEDTTDTAIPFEKKNNRSLAGFRLIGRRLLSAIVTLIVIAYLTLFGLLLAQRGREHLPAQPVDAIRRSAVSLFEYFIHHPETYSWNKQAIPAFELLRDILGKSAGLLLGSMAVALVLGVSLGVTAALSRRKFSSAFVVVLSILGISTPSFLLAMLFWVINISVHRIFEVKVLPSAGFGWDAHLVMPILVLSMRPLAQIAQITYVSLLDVLRQDYIRTAHAKGLAWHDVRNRHALRNVLIPIFTTLGTSLRFSLASLAIVELFFEWPGVGSTLFEAINRGEVSLVVDLILALGVFFLVVNLLLEIMLPWLDARVAQASLEESLEEENSFGRWWSKVFEIFKGWRRDAHKARQMRNKSQLPPLPAQAVPNHSSRDESITQSNRRWILRNFIANPALLIGLLLLIGLVGLVFFGSSLTSANPYQTHGVMTINGKIFAPPFIPSSVFPWGSDYVGRDIQALVFYGARQTLSLALFGMLARLALGVGLGALAGWTRRSWLDRLVTGAIGVWAAFPITLFAMIVIQALGIQQGMSVFVVTVCIVGWGEIAQFVRGQVISIKPQLYVESARSAGLRSDQIMIRHIAPNLINGLVALAALEMGGVLMLLAELGYLNIFLGGGFQAVIGEAGRMQPVIVSYSDVPEWAAMIANIRAWWRSYPWMVIYPGIAFFISILAFNLTGDGLRRFLDESQVNLSRLFNRYTFSTGIGLILVLALVLQGASPLSLYKSEALKFNAQNVLKDIRVLSSFEMQGRESGTPGAQKAAEYIAQRMREVGLIPAGEHGTYLQNQVSPRLHLTHMPTLELLNSNGEVSSTFRYRRDFAELAVVRSYGENEAEIMGLVYGEPIDAGNVHDPYGLANTDAYHRIAIVRGVDFTRVNLSALDGVLVVADDFYSIQRKDAYPYEGSAFGGSRNIPVMVISPDLADQLLATAGSSLSDLDQMAKSAAAGQVALTKPGTKVHMTLLPETVEDETHEYYTNVVGIYPGEGAVAGLDNQVIIVSAYYDGLGMGPDGTIYPGANDNASGVATLLEIARLLKASAYKPDKTVLFVAWSGGERAERFSVVNVTNARPGGNSLKVMDVIELSGLGYGTGKAIAMSEESSYRLVRLFQSAARKLGVATTTRGRDPHYGRAITFQFGERSALTLSLSWDGSDHLAHTTADTPEIIDPKKLAEVGSSTVLVLFVLSRETNY